MFVDVSEGSNKIRVNVDIDFFYFPCDILSIDVQDIMGSHSVKVEGDIDKTRLSSNGDLLERTKYIVNGEPLNTI